jgi:hypothetical protein
MIIIGAGMAGLIAANYFRKRNPTVIEKQASLPDNHGALLRFKTDKVFRVAGLSATKVTVRKCIVYGQDFMSGPNPYLANMYSEKVTGRIEDRSIWNTATEERFIAPPDFLARLADGCNIKFEREAIGATWEGDKFISTIPMPTLMKQLGWKDIPKFEFKPIWTITADLPGVNINQTIYFPEMDVPYYRASFVGSRFIIELVRDPGDEAESLTTEVLDYFGFLKKCEITVKHQPLGKMLPIDNQLRKEFMHYATSNYNIYSLGRFATWRPILLDDVVDDLAAIERMMSSSYEALRVNSLKV